MSHYNRKSKQRSMKKKENNKGNKFYLKIKVSIVIQTQSNKVFNKFKFLKEIITVEKNLVQKVKNDSKIT